MYKNRYQVEISSAVGNSCACLIKGYVCAHPKVMLVHVGARLRDRRTKSLRLCVPMCLTKTSAMLVATVDFLITTLLARVCKIPALLP